MAQSTFATLGLADVVGIMKASLAANKAIMLWGAPGTGKTQITGDLSKEVNMDLEVLILSQCDSVDIGGAMMPNLDHTEALRLPLGPIKRASKKGVILFLDELPDAPRIVQAAAMRLVHERQAGDVHLHPDTRIIAAGNPPHMSAGSQDMVLPLINRMTQVWVKPTVKEVQKYFYNLGENGSHVRALSVDMAATLENAPSLLQIEPPLGVQAEGRPWGSPRAWERAIRLCAAVLDMKYDEESTLFSAALGGNLGDDVASSYMQIRKLREKLPSIADILKDPEKAKLPEDQATACAALGIIAQVGLQDPCAAWVYGGRMDGEAKTAATRVLSKFEIKTHNKQGCKMWKKADDAQTKLISGLKDLLD